VLLTPPVLHNELRSRSLVQVYPESNSVSDSASPNSSVHKISRRRTSQLFVPEEHELAQKQEPRDGMSQGNRLKPVLMGEQSDLSSQQVNCFNPPMKASQLRVRQPTSALQKIDQTTTLIVQDEELERDSEHALPPQGLQMVHATTRAQTAMMPQSRLLRRQIELRAMMAKSVACGYSRVEEEHNQLTSNESVLINKVNEMQTKSASFGY